MIRNDSLIRALSMIAIGLIGTAPTALAGGATVTRLTNVVNAYPHPSPDGTRVVFQSNRTGTAQIFVMNADGNEMRQLTDRELGAETPKWSPDGRSILFAAYVGENNNDLFVMGPDGSNVRQLTSVPDADDPNRDDHRQRHGDGE